MSPNNKLVLGTFNSEHYWKDKDLCTLPSFQDQDADLILSVMDEMLFVFCDSVNDLLITRLPFNKAHATYLNDIGFRFSFSTQMVSDEFKDDQNIFALLAKSNNEYFRSLIHSDCEVLPYSVIPDTGLFLKNYKIKGPVPDIDIVKKVNSKIYSHTISENISGKNGGYIIQSVTELNNKGSELLKNGPFLMKETLGVSGKGNLLISNGKLFDRIIRYIEKQEKEGKKILLLIEPLLDKMIDFSCQIEIKKDGDFRIISLQQMHNKGFAFHGIQTFDSSLKKILDKNNYFSQIELIAKELFEAGYFGSACIDSMIVKNNKVIPIIEINARKSMGLINHYIDEFLSKQSLKGKLLYFSLAYQEKVNFETILENFNSNKLLFTRNNPSGVLPLTSNALSVNYDYTPCTQKNENYRGRLYFSVISKSEEEENRILNDTKNILNTLNLLSIN